MVKKIFKYINILSIIFLLTGCTVTYNLKISGNTIVENISLMEKENLVDEEVADGQIDNLLSSTSETELKKYNTSKSKKNGNIIYDISQTYFLNDISSVNNIRIMKECFDAYNIVYSNDEETAYILQTSKGFHCLNYDYNEIDSVDINIEIDNEVISNNADNQNGNIYTWHIDKENYSDKYISLEFSNKITEEENNSKETFNFMYILIGIGVIVGIIIIVLLYAMGLNKKRNEL